MTAPNLFSPNKTLKVKNTSSQGKQTNLLLYFDILSFIISRGNEDKHCKHSLLGQSIGPGFHLPNSEQKQVSDTAGTCQNSLHQRPASRDLVPAASSLPLLASFYSSIILKYWTGNFWYATPIFFYLIEEHIGF